MMGSRRNFQVSHLMEILLSESFICIWTKWNFALFISVYLLHDRPSPFHSSHRASGLMAQNVAWLSELKSYFTMSKNFWPQHLHLHKLGFYGIAKNLQFWPFHNPINSSFYWGLLALFNIQSWPHSKCM